MDSTQPISDGSQDIKLVGLRSIIILNPSILKMRQPSKLLYYHGSVTSGSQLDTYDGCRAIILKLVKLKPTEELYMRLAAVDHPCVIKALGFAYGVGTNDTKCSYLALEPFDTTFTSYTQKNGLGVDINGRFVEEMITLISNIVAGVEELHNLGFYCPGLKGDDIAVMRKGRSISAKILIFESCVAGKEEVQKNADWSRLGKMLEHVAWTFATTDLVGKIKSGQLKGQSILKHSALLTVRKKVQNALALYHHISVYYPKESDQSQSMHDWDASEICVANLKSVLDKKLTWKTPACVTAHVTEKTLRGFVKLLRVVFEHESQSIPPELTLKEIRELQKAKDLDHHLAETNGELCLAVQRLVAELNLKY